VSARSEYALIGALLVDPEAFDGTASVVEVEDFAERRASTVYLAMMRLRCTGTPIDFVTVADELERTGELDRLGTAFLVTVAASAPSSLHVGTYARRVAEDGAARRGSPRRTRSIAEELGLTGA
jgi:replicative DNA helicase